MHIFLVILYSFASVMLWMSRLPASAALSAVQPWKTILTATVKSHWQYSAQTANASNTKQAASILPDSSKRMGRFLSGRLICHDTVFVFPWL